MQVQCVDSTPVKSASQMTMGEMSGAQAPSVTWVLIAPLPRQAPLQLGHGTDATVEKRFLKEVLEKKYPQ